jgi:uncharacterized membrane protein
MVENKDMKMCMAVVTVIALVLLVFGFLDMFKVKPTGNQVNKVDVISQQLRGLGFFLLALVVLSLGSALCFQGFHTNKPTQFMWDQI